MMMVPDRKRLVVGLTGASGMIYGKILLERLASLHDSTYELHAVLSSQAEKVWEFEIGPFSPRDYPFRFYAHDDFFAPMASGSAGFGTMIICPCTMGTMGRIASGVSMDLMTRAADVILKERGKLILVPRETPYSSIHIRNMEILTSAGAVICPASPSFYSRPATVTDLAATVVDRVLQLAGINLPGYRWGEEPDTT